jgi:hypothetical protein
VLEKKDTFDRRARVSTQAAASVLMYGLEYMCVLNPVFFFSCVCMLANMYLLVCLSESRCNTFNGRGRGYLKKESPPQKKRDAE